MKAKQQQRTEEQRNIGYWIPQSSHGPTALLLCCVGSDLLGALLLAISLFSSLTYSTTTMTDASVESLLTYSISASFDPALVINGETGDILSMNDASTNQLFTDADDEQKSNINILLNFDGDDNEQDNSRNWHEGVEMNSPKTISASYTNGSNKFDLTLRCVKHSGTETSYIVMYLKSCCDEATTSQRQQNVMQATVDASFDAMLSINSSGTIVTANKAATTLFAYNEEEFLGQNISMICGKEHASNHDAYLKRYLETGITKIIGKKREVPARKKNGEEFPVELGIVEVKHGDNEHLFCAFVKDLTDQKKAEQEIRLRESLTLGLLNCSFDPMLQIDEQGIIRIVNEATCSLFDYTKEELIGSNVQIICGSEGGISHKDHHQQYIANYLKSGRKKVIGRKRPTVGRRKDGTEFDIELAVSGMQWKRIY